MWKYPEIVPSTLQTSASAPVRNRSSGARASARWSTTSTAAGTSGRTEVIGGTDSVNRHARARARLRPVGKIMRGYVIRRAICQSKACRTLGLLPTKSLSNTVSWLTLTHSFKKIRSRSRQISYNMNPGQTSGVQLGSGATRAARLSELHPRFPFDSECPLSCRSGLRWALGWQSAGWGDIVGNSRIQ
jgi:hypothetical protein